jgi:FkbM family methyltransferase
MVLSARRLLTAALDRVGRDERAAAMLSAALENVGAQTLADRIDRRRSGGGIEPIVLPAGPNAFRRRRIKMFRLNGNDQIVRAVRNGGWRAFECPLPDVYCLFARLSTGQVYDVGANTGFYSLVAVTANHGVTVHAFEPARDVFPLLERNVGLCPHRAHITMTATAVSDKVGEAEFFVPLSSGVVETSSSLEGGFKESHLETYRVPVITLDDYWRHGGRQPVSMIKIDCGAPGNWWTPAARCSSSRCWKGHRWRNSTISAVRTILSTCGSAPPNSSSATRSAGTRRPGTTSSSPGNVWTANSPRWPRSVSG